MLGYTGLHTSMDLEINKSNKLRTVRFVLRPIGGINENILTSRPSLFV